MPFGSVMDSTNPAAFINAGFGPIFVIRHHGKVEMLNGIEATSIPFGLTDGFRFESTSVNLESAEQRLGNRYFFACGRRAPFDLCGTKAEFFPRLSLI